jgi:cobalt-precorrin-5B (C1)-methyltransferase
MTRARPLRMSEAERATPLRRGWTTGACAAGAARAAFEALLTGRFPDPVPVALPKGLRPEFALATQELGAHFARAAIVKDAGDDPDVTHGALIVATVRLARPGAGLSFEAGEGVGTVTRPGLPLPVGEPAINPAPRAMIRANLGEVAARLGAGADAIVEISIPGGERIAKRTANERLGIVGGLSILGTTGIVIPYSCSAWIASIHRGVDVARASGCTHIGAATGETSEAAIRALYGLPDHALIEMGDFVGGLLKYLREHPVARLTIAGGPAKMTKLAEGKLDLHSKRGAVDLAALAERVADAAGSPTVAEAIASANSGLHAFELAQAAGFDLPALVAGGAWATAAAVLAGQPGEVETIVVGRDGRVLASSGFRRV